LAPLTAGTESGLLPTPQAQDAKHSGANAQNRIDQGRQLQLAHVTFFWPTPNASDGKVGIVDRSRLETLIRTGKAKKRKDGGDYQIKLLERVISEEIRQARLTSRPQINLNDQVGGQLNPTWVELLMGFPAGWTDISDEA
jgi:hypothetical protein